MNIDDFDLIEDEDEEEWGVCSECGELTRIITVNTGIGSYEYWGMKAVHHEFEEVSLCCHAPIEE